MTQEMEKVTSSFWKRGLIAVGGMGALLLGAYLLARGPMARQEQAQSEQVDVPAPSGFFDEFLKVYTPRRACMQYEAPVIWLHLISDSIIAIAYYSIPIALVYFVWRRKDIAFHWMFWMFAAFILACGTTHIFGVIDLWTPFYRLDGIVKLATGLISIVTAVALWPLIPQALALPSPSQLEGTIRERTAEIGEMNKALRAEIEARTQAERERERLLEREREARVEAERANQLKDQFLATLSHELRAPLNAILGWSFLLRKRRSNEEFTEGLAIIERNTRVQTRLIEDLLDVSRIIAGKMRLDLQTVNLADVIGLAVEAITPAAAAKDIRIRQVLDPRAGPVTGDAARLQQVMWNLLANAVKFAPKGGKVEVLLERINSHVEITVTDNGEGISPEFLPHLFQRFSQADASTTRRYGGLGLGLAIVRHIVELHGGSVRAASPGPGQGATFTVMLPLRMAMTQEAPEDRPHPAVPATAGPPPVPWPGGLAGLKVLAIDDDGDSREFVRRLLEEVGASVLTTANAAEGLELLRRERPDVILCDIGLPHTDGYEFLRQVRELAGDEGGATPAIAVTAFARSEDRTLAMRAGFQNHVAKPFEPAELIATIGGLVGRVA